MVSGYFQVTCRKIFRSNKNHRARERVPRRKARTVNTRGKDRVSARTKTGLHYQLLRPNTQSQHVAIACLSCTQEPHTWHYRFPTFAPWSNTSVSEDVKPGNLLPHPQGVPSYNLAASYLPSLPTAETKFLRPGKSHPCIHLQILQRSLALVTLR